MATYPGSQILFEVGTRKELAKIYGVSERTIYRWMNKAQSETGAKPHKARRPRMSTLANFQGTRKELANKYKVSERTIYRWLAAAKDKGVDIESRSKTSKYPGPEILASKKTNKKLADEYGVSVRTINRWKNQAREELSPYEPIAYSPENMTAAEPLPEGPFEQPTEEPVEGPWEVPEDIDEDYKDLDISPKSIDNLIAISDMLDDLDLLKEGSMFNDFSKHDKVKYLNSYIQWCYDQDPKMFYDKETGEFRFDSEWMSQLNIWGNDFEEWLIMKKESDDFFIK